MRARKYNKKIEIWQTTTVIDGYGGGGVQSTKLASVWCEFITLDALIRTTDIGQTDTNNKLIIKVRKTPTIKYMSRNTFFIYRGIEYIIQGTPINIGFEDRELQLTLVGKSATPLVEVSYLQDGSGNFIQDGEGNLIITPNA
jgi:SPP1 family predicted phage head-tail adaptor